jgi:hypothetical protein
MPLPVSMDATWLNGSTQFNAQELRRADAAEFNGDGSAFGVRGGIVRHGDQSLVVTVNASDVVTIQPGAVVVPGNSGVGNGCYRSALGAAETGNLTARNATNPRIDLVVFRVYDDDVVTTHNLYTGRIEVIAGTPAASPVAPALPSLAVELARITVPATGGGAATVDSSQRQYVSGIGAELTVASFARLPASAAKYQRARALDTGVEYEWTGTAWQQYFSQDRDTGLRDITALCGTAFKTQYPTSRVYVRRIGSTVHIMINVKENVAGSSLTIMSSASEVFPAGFRQPQVESGGTRRQAIGQSFRNSDGGIGGAQLLVTNVTFATDLAMYGLAAGASCTGLITFTTSEAWPAVLPGTASAL